MSAVANFKHCYGMARACYPVEKNHSVRKRLRFSLRLFYGYRATTKNVESFFAETALRRFVMALPEFREHLYIQQVRPCFYRNSTSAHRTFFLTSHFQFLERTHKEEIVRKLYSQSLNSISLQERDNTLSFSIGFHPGILKEGFLQLAVAMNNVALCRITFWFMQIGGVTTLCIGALQGGKDALEANHAFTKSYWGLRPQNMAMTILRWYAQAAGVKQIYTFPKKHLWSTKIVRQTDLDGFWQEQGATPVAQTPFIKLYLDVPRKEFSEIATRKRSAYRKRYAFLDRVQSTLASQFEDFMKVSHATG